MPYIVCVEEREGRWIAHVPDLPGCFAAHEQRDRAVQAVPHAVESFVEWCHESGIRVSGLAGPMIVAEVIRAWEFEDGQMVHAFFASDRPSVLEDEIPEYRSLLIASHTSLLRSIEAIDVDDAYRPLNQEGWSIADGLEVFGQFELYYLDRLGFGTAQDRLPEDPVNRLESIREHHLNILPQLAARKGTVTMAGETWSARKILRTTLWTERELAENFRRYARWTA
ncbi:MAG: type II toxin-antitoxin system HicB family antitoxin [Anaerolineales bacterium]|nr:type II toxin-antitoxin system HicB family antitoxin [Anaerolineales bacterium]